jgi:hypothetical protein
VLLHGLLLSSSFSFFGFSLSLLLLVKSLLASDELLLNFLKSGLGAGHPGVFADLLHSGPLLGVELEETVDQVDEIFGEEALRLILRVSSPEQVVSVSADQLVEGIFRLGASEWRVLGEHDEKDDSSSE